jgi:hypothetical protein
MKILMKNLLTTTTATNLIVAAMAVYRTRTPST